MNDTMVEAVLYAVLMHQERRQRLHQKEIDRLETLHAEAFQSHPAHASIESAILADENSIGLELLIRNEAERRMEMLLALAERRLIDDENPDEHGGAPTGNLEWLRTQYADSLAIAAIMALGFGPRVYPSYDGLHAIGGGMPLASLHGDLFTERSQDGNAEYRNLARVLMAVNDTARQQSLWKDGMEKALSRPGGSYDSALYQSFLRTRVLDRLETARLMQDPSIPDGESIDSGAIEEWDDDNLLVHMDNEARHLPAHAVATETIVDLEGLHSAIRSWMDDRNDDAGVILTSLFNGALSVEGRRPMVFEEADYEEGRYAEPESRVAPSTWMWGNRFHGRLSTATIPGIHQQAEISLMGLGGDGLLGIHGIGSISIYPDGNFRGSFDESPIFDDQS